jgi:hypothetical protein
MGDQMKRTGVVDKETAQEALQKAMSKDKYSGKLDNEKISRSDKLKMVNELLTDLHLNLIGTGRVSTTEAKNFRHFVKKEFEKVIKDKESAKGEKGSKVLSDVVWSGYNAYVRFKLEKIDEIKKKKAARIQKILDRREARRR